MDTSDGLADALFKIAKASNCTIKALNIEGMFGAEDYNLVAAVPKNIVNNVKDSYVIGEVIEFNGAYLEVDNKRYIKYEDLGIYDHFKE